MINYLQAEILKQKHRFHVKLLWLSPLFIIALVLSLGVGNHLKSGAYNWWYTIMLPGTLSMIITSTIAKELKHNRHHLFAVVIDKRKLWVAQILINTIFLLLLNMIFYISTISVGSFLGVSLPLVQCLIGSFVLFVTFAWQIPLLMFASEKIGTISTIISSLLLNIGVGIFCATETYWYVPFAIPTRLMCPILQVLPNGLPLEMGNELGDRSVIPLGISITVALYFIGSISTTVWFKNREVK